MLKNSLECFWLFHEKFPHDLNLDCQFFFGNIILSICHMLIFKQANHMPIGFFENVNLYYISVFNKKN